MKNIKYNNNGITLIELIITLAIMLLVIQMMYSIFFIGNKSFNVSKNKGFAQQEARIVADFINNELKTSKEISENKLMGMHYSLSLNDKGQLSRKTYNEDGSEDENKEKLISNNLSEIKFQGVDGNQKGIINITINATEGEKTKDKQKYSLDINVLLENLPDFNKSMDENIIYYSKYE